MEIVTKNISNCYKELLKMLYSGGKGIVKSNPRGKTTYEFEYPITIIYQNPRERLLYIPGRKLNLAFSLAEAIWILSGNGSVDWISFYNANMRSFADEEKEFFNAAYGKRIRDWGYGEPEIVKDKKNIRDPHTGEILNWENAAKSNFIFDNYMTMNHPIDQFAGVYNKLKEDLDTRQACISLWDPRKDLLLDGCKDYPCNSFIQFRYKNGKLNLYIFRRSNDIIWGIPYNVVQFSYLLEMMCGWLDVEMGYVSEFITSLHVYFNNDPKQDETTLHTLNTDAIDIYTDSNYRPRKAIKTTDARMSKETFEKMFVSFYTMEKDLRNDYQGQCNIFMHWIFESPYLNNHWKQVMLMILLHHAYKAKDDITVFEIYDKKLCDEYKIFTKDFYKRIQERHDKNR
jgi:thymidylate synthase